VGHHDTANGVHQVLGLKIGKLLLLIAQFNIEEVVVDLGDDGLQRYAALHARRTYNGRDDAARIDKTRCARVRQGSLFKEARWMARSRHLLDALSEWAGAAANVEDLGLIQRNFNGARPDEVCCRVDICKGCVHGFSPPPWGRD
jgi:hypothetical protein